MPHFVNLNFNQMKYLLIFVMVIAFCSCKSECPVEDHLKLKSKLAGKWKAKAFDGELHEEWKLGNKGWMEQEGYYIEKGDTSYAAKSQIQGVGEDVILFSVIRNSDPKIFKSIELKDSEMVFENKDYENPFRVRYEFLSDTKYRRTITGYQNDSLVVYEFNFEKSN